MSGARWRLHAANFLVPLSELTSGVIALSGVYSTRDFFGKAPDGGIYFNSPLDYPRGLTDELTERLRGRDACPSAAARAPGKGAC